MNDDNMKLKDFLRKWLRPEDDIGRYQFEHDLEKLEDE
jgi:hypothetical protein